MSIVQARADIRNLVIPRGKLHFDAWDAANSRYEGMKDLGEASNAELELTIHKSPYYSGRSGYRTKVYDPIVSMEAKATLTVENITLSNLARFVVGGIAAIAQTAVEVVDEAIGPVTAGLIYQLGRSVSNPLGVAGVSALALISKAGDLASAYATGSYVLGDRVIPTVANGYYYRVTTAGTVVTEPTRGNTIGGVTVDGGGTAEFTCIGTTALTVDVDYEADLTTGEFSPLAGSELAATLALADVTDDEATVLATYTPIANSRYRVSGPQVTTQYGSFLLRGDTTRSPHHNWFGPYCALTPTGAIPLLSNEADVVSLTFEVEFLSPPVGAHGTDLIYIDDEPVTG
jgi:hypothetical protein